MPYAPGSYTAKSVKVAVNVADDVADAAKGVKNAGNAVEAVTDVSKTAKVAKSINNASDMNALLRKTTKSKVLKQLNQFDDLKIAHLINGSKKKNHHWERIMKNVKWKNIKKVICEVVTSGTYQVYGKETNSVVKTIKGHVVTVTFGIDNGNIKIGSAWVD